MDFFLLGIVAFLLANIAVVVSMLRRINLNNESVMAWEQANLVSPATPVVQPQPIMAHFPAVELAEAA